MMKPFLQMDISEYSVEAIAEGVKPPVSRTLFDQAMSLAAHIPSAINEADFNSDSESLHEQRASTSSSRPKET
jgi:hypothetical protein